MRGGDYPMAVKSVLKVSCFSPRNSCKESFALVLTCNFQWAEEDDDDTQNHGKDAEISCHSSKPMCPIHIPLLSTVPRLAEGERKRWDHHLIAMLLDTPCLGYWGNEGPHLEPNQEPEVWQAEGTILSVGKDRQPPFWSCIQDPSSFII